MTSIRTLALAAALFGAAAAPAFAEGHYVSGPVAVPAWTQADNSRTVLAGPDQGAAAQRSLSRSGATGSGGQHS